MDPEEHKLSTENKQQLIIANKKHRNTIESDSDEEGLMQKIMNQKVKENNLNGNNRRPPEPLDRTAEKQSMQMDIESKQIKQFKFQQLPEDVVFYMTEICQLNNKLYITGIMPHGQTINIIASEPLKELYFCIKSSYSDTQIITEHTLNEAKREIEKRLFNCGIKNFAGEYKEKEYVFQIQGVPREKRPYFQVRYPFKVDSRDEPKPDWQGEHFKLVFGTTYTPLELFIINTGIKGPSWVKVEKKYLNENNKLVQYGLCAQIQDPELIQVVNDLQKPPNMRVMSISIKTVTPSQVKIKKLFNTNRPDDLHIYAISYFVCQDYLVQLKPNKYNGISRTLFLKEFGVSKDKDLIQCENEKQMIGLFQAELRKYDPDVIVCHDSSKILDSLVQRLAKISDKFDKPKLGRFINANQFSKSNQYQRINSALTGRLLVDTFVHSKDMIKSIDYELQSMANHIKPQRRFKGMSEQQTLQYLNNFQTMHIIRKVKEEAQVTFALMNHLEILQMTRQLSNICGIIWKRSLENQRAERNEYLIMHECFKRDLIIPDKFRKDKNAEEDQETDRKKYQGGHVLDPEKGFYKDFILLLDFNSLYPSIIRQYNVCFSVINRPLVPLSNFYKNREKNTSKKQKIKEEGSIQTEEIEVVPPPKDECTKEKWGFLPQLIDKIVQRRKKCKKAMKNASAQKCIILDIQQKCYKLVANSIYGCLGFSISRFYSKHLAALITRMGREALLRAKDIVGTMGGVKVIYGDTDSLMIQPYGLQKDNDRQKLFQIKKIAEELKKNINKEYTNLEIDIDGIFKPLILLMKKKYVARKLNNYEKIIGGIQQTLNFSIEYKGIQVVRRDGFELSRKFLKHILEILMNSTKSQPQETYEEIYAYVKEINTQFSKISFKDFLFSKQLNKLPKEYAKGQTIPHVKVALDRIKNGQRQQTLVNHTIYYMVCKPKDKSQDSLAKCCFDDRTYERQLKFYGEKGPLEIDQEYYKKELVQPVWRITQHLQDFSADRFLEELGLSDDARKKFRKQMEADREQGQIILDGSISNNNAQKSKLFADTIGQIICLCGQNTMAAQKGKLVTNCPHCQKSLIAVISNKITSAIKEKLHEYYSNKLKCRCGKQYTLNPISQCCKIKYKPRSNIPFEIHELIYVTKDMINISIKELANYPNSNELKKLKILQEKLNDFLEHSDFERVKGLSNLFKI